MSVDIRRQGGVGQSVRRVDGVPKVKGEFEYASDLRRDGMLWGETVRSPHPYARIKAIDIRAALESPGVRAVLLAGDGPGKKTYGLDVQDQPVLAWDVVRFAGEPVALVAAEQPEQAKQAAPKIEVTYEVLSPVTEMEAALQRDAPKLHPQGNGERQRRVIHGDPGWQADQCPRETASRRRGLHVHLAGRHRQRHYLRGRPLCGAQRPAGRDGGLHQQPALRRHARVRRRAGLLRL